MLFQKFSKYLEELEKLPSRLDMTELLAVFFKELEPDEIETACYLMQGKLVPKYKSLEFQLSSKIVARALARIEGPSVADTKVNDLFEEIDYSEIEKQVYYKFKQLGDLGKLSQEIIENYLEKPATKKSKHFLSLKETHKLLVEIANESGSGSQESKVIKLVELLKQVDGISAKFIVRIIIGKLRLGFSIMTMIDALSWAKKSDKTDNKLLENAYQKKADIGLLAKIYLQSKPDDSSNLLEKYSIEEGIPVVPALCQRLNSAAEIIEKMDEVIAEPKYDGLRIQIHINKKNNSYMAFTRGLDDVSHMFPELIKVANSLDCESCILDAEAIGYVKNSDELLPFQQTITRRRKHNIDEQSQLVPIRFYVFDLLAVNGESWLDFPLSARKGELRNLFKDSPTLMFTPFIVTKDHKLLREFHENQLGCGLEGAVIKKIDSLYRSGRKGWRWVKIKEEEGSTGKLKDTLDLVVMGYYFGRGKRAQFGIGAFLAGVLDKNQEIKTIAKIGTGLSDDQLRDLKNRGQILKSSEKPNIYEVPKVLIPDVWMNPELVVEIAADEITKSPNHSAGVALRFPRLIKFRDDKNWSDATTLGELDKF